MLGGVERAGAARSRRLSSQTRVRIIGAVVGASAVAGAFAGGHSTDLAAADVVLSAGLAAVVAWLTSYARRWTWSWLAGAAAVATVGRPLAMVVALVALALALASVRMHRRRRLAGVVVGALAIQALLHIGAVGPFGVPALVVAAAVLPAVVSGYRLLPSHSRRQGRRVALALGGAVALAAVAAGVVALLVREDLEQAVSRSEAAVAGVGEADQQAALDDLRLAQADFAGAADLLGSPLLTPARALPVIGPHVGALREMAAAGEELSATAAANLDLVAYDELRYRSGRVNLDAVAAVSGPLRDVRTALASADARTGRIDSPWLATPVTDRIDDLRDRLAATRSQAATAQLAVDLAPEMLGGDGLRRYLLVFPSPSEMRGGGGFVGNYAVLDATDGEVTLTESSRMSTLIDARPPGERSIEGLDEYLARYGRFQPEDFHQDILYSPHFPWDADAFSQVAVQSGRPSIEAVISIAPAGLAALLDLTGPVPVSGRAEPLTADNAEQFLLLDQYLTYDDDDVRADALQAATRTTFERLTTGSLPSPRVLGDLFSPLLPTHDLQMWSARPTEQRVLRELGVTAELPPADGNDLVHVSAINGGNNKIDVFLEREVSISPRLDEATGEVVSEVEVTLRNRAPASGLPSYVIDNRQDLPQGTNRMLLSVFTPLGLEDAFLDGEPIGVEVGRERGYRVYGRYIEVPPGASVTFTLALRGRIPGMDRYRLVVPAQPMVNPDRLRLTGPLVGRDGLVELDRTRTTGADR